MILLGGLIVPLVQKESVQRTFVYVADKPLKSVALVGDFQGCDKGATPMVLEADGRTWNRSVPLNYGKHQYKFVIDGEEWIVDPKGKTVDDGNGHQNFEIVVLPPGYETPALPKDGRITVGGLSHPPNLPDVNVDRARMTIRMRVRANDVAAVELRPLGMKPLRTARVAGDEAFDVYEAVEPNLKVRLSYLFALADGGSWRSFGAEGLDKETPFVYDPATARRIEVPSWPEGGVVYQLFPNRLANGDPKNDLKGTLP